MSRITGHECCRVAVLAIELGLIVFIHRLGHFLAAKGLRIPVRELAYGFGPLLASHSIGETRYALRRVPLGGSVTFGVAAAEDPSPVARVMMLLSGFVANCAAAALVLVVIGFVRGIPSVELNSVLGTVVAGGPADLAGLRVGDTVIAVDGAPVETFSDLKNSVERSDGRTISVTALRNGERVNLRVTPILVDDPATRRKSPRIGVQPASHVIMRFTAAKGAGEVLQEARRTVTQVVWLPFEIVRRLADGSMKSSELARGTGGPLLLLSFVMEFNRQGPWVAGYFWAEISVSLGLWTLLPFPGLDGFRIVVVVIGAVTGRKPEARKELMVERAGYFVMAVFLIYMAARDLTRG